MRAFFTALKADLEAIASRAWSYSPIQLFGLSQLLGRRFDSCRGHFDSDVLLSTAEDKLMLVIRPETPKKLY
jgi:hypothetical protein